MIINGREVNFFYSAGAHCDFDDFVIQNKDKGISETHARIQEALILNHWYLKAHPEDKTKPLTLDEIQLLSDKELTELIEQVAIAEIRDSQQTVTAEADEKNATSTKAK